MLSQKLPNVLHRHPRAQSAHRGLVGEIALGDTLGEALERHSSSVGLILTTVEADAVRFVTFWHRLYFSSFTAFLLVVFRAGLEWW